MVPYGSENSLVPSYGLKCRIFGTLPPPPCVRRVVETSNYWVTYWPCWKLRNIVLISPTEKEPLYHPCPPVRGPGPGAVYVSERSGRFPAQIIITPLHHLCKRVFQQLYLSHLLHGNAENIYYRYTTQLDCGLYIFLYWRAISGARHVSKWPGRFLDEKIFNPLWPSM